MLGIVLWDSAGQAWAQKKSQSTANQVDTTWLQPLRQFARKRLKLVVGDSFFTRMQSPAGAKLQYLYVSEPNRVKPVGPVYRFFGTDSLKARDSAQAWQKRGYPTMLYQTAGTSSAKLNQRLLSYPAPSAGFVVLHEAFHRHAKSLNLGLPYELEEAACDLLGNYGLLLFALETRRLDSNEVMRQNVLHESLYDVLNKYYILLNNDPAEEAALFRQAEREIQGYLKLGTAFHRDRFDYPVNRAYLLRYLDYMKNYDRLKLVLTRLGDIPPFLRFMEELPKDRDQALQRIEQFLLR